MQIIPNNDHRKPSRKSLPRQRGCYSRILGVVSEREAGEPFGLLPLSPRPRPGEGCPLAGGRGGGLGLLADVVEELIHH